MVALKKRLGFASHRSKNYHGETRKMDKASAQQHIARVKAQRRRLAEQPKDADARLHG